MGPPRAALILCIVQCAARIQATCQSASCQTLTLWYRQAQGFQRAAGAGAADLSGPSVLRPTCREGTCHQLQLQHAQGLHHNRAQHRTMLLLDAQCCSAAALLRTVEPGKH